MTRQRRTKKQDSVQQKVNAIRAELQGTFINRDREINGLLVAFLTGEHALLLGPPGTAKSMLTEALCGCIQGGKLFNWLLTRFTSPEELFGPHSLPGLKQGTFERITTGKLPEAHIAFLDEVFKGNSSVLNSILRLINERKFENGTKTLHCPLQSVVGASNELPESKELGAFYDRFMLRFWIDYLPTREERKALLKMHMQPRQPMQSSITLQELEQAQQEAASIHISEDMCDLILDVQEALEKAGFIASDRSWGKCLKLIQAQAYLNGHSQVEESDLSILADSLWKDPQDRHDLGRVVIKASNPVAAQIAEVLDVAKEMFQDLPMSREITDAEAGAVFQQIVNCNAAFKQQIKTLEKLGDSTPIMEAINEIEAMSKKASRFAAKVSGLDI